MDAWINAIAELTGIGNWGTDASLSDLSVLVPDARWLLVVGVMVVFCLATVCQEARTGRRENKESDRNRL